MCDEGMTNSEEKIHNYHQVFVIKEMNHFVKVILTTLYILNEEKKEGALNVHLTHE
jgi:hypothetical protein